MATKINPPVFTSETNYERYKIELLAWREVTELPKKKQGIVIALSLPESVREKVFDNLTLDDDLKADDSLDKLVVFLDKCLGKDELEDSLQKFEDFEDYVRSSSESVSDFIDNFDHKYLRIKKRGMVLPEAILAFKLLRCAKITKEEKMLVLTGMDYTNKTTLYDQAKKSLKKFLGEGSSNTSTSESTAIKLEPAFLAEHEEALYASGYVRRKYGGRFRGRGSWRGRGSSQSYQPASFRSGSKKTGVDRPVNPDGPDGQPMTCRACGSYRHFIKDCPDSWENREKLSKVNITSDERDQDKSKVGDVDSAASDYGVLFTGSAKSNVSLLGVEAQCCAVLDSACTSTVCGQSWLDSYLDTLNKSNLDKVRQSEGEKTFKFGGGTKLKSTGTYLLPGVIAGKEVTIQTDVVNSDIPLLLSRLAMKKAGVKLDLINDTAEIMGKTVPLNVTSSGHYCIPIDSLQGVAEESVYSVKLRDISVKDRKKILLKLHRQFAHPSDSKLVSLLRDAGIWEDDYMDLVNEIYSKCNFCKRYRATPPRPVVSLPMASMFNEMVSMDLKQWKAGWILHIIDMWSRFSVSVIVDRKQTSTIIHSLIEHWIGVFGVMESILTDNGGEFSSEEMREVTSILNVKVFSTAAESPWSNGLCERVHCIIDGMLTKLEAEYPETPTSTLLCWTNMAKNALQMWQGYSSYQLVFGKNPNLPNIMSEKLPGLEGCTNSRVLAKHLNSLNAARRAFIESEASERIRRALRSKVRTSEQFFENGDSVFYKRDGKERWLGPAKVLFQDGKVIFVRHGGVFVRVSPNRLVRVGHEFFDNTSTKISETPALEPAAKTSSDCTSELIANERDTVSDRNSNVLPQAGDVIEFRKQNSDPWEIAHVMGRAGKATGKYSDWYNLALSGTKEMFSMCMKDVEWKKYSQEEDVNMVLIPLSQQDDPECDQAKAVELEKLKQFETKR